jgi:hypothetical protein
VETQEIAGYFAFDCQPDGYCTFGCGKRPNIICAACHDHAVWTELETVPDNLHPMYAREDGDYVDVCDNCGEMF